MDVQNDETKRENHKFGHLQILNKSYRVLLKEVLDKFLFKHVA